MVNSERNVAVVQTWAKPALPPNMGKLLEGVFMSTGHHRAFCVNIESGEDIPSFLVDGTSTCFQEEQQLRLLKECDEANRHSPKGVFFPEVPKLAYEETSTNVGGLGEHIRWKVMDARVADDTKMEILVGLCEDEDGSPVDGSTREELHASVTGDLYDYVTVHDVPIVFIDAGRIRHEASSFLISHVCALTTKRKHLKFVAAYLQSKNFYVEAVDASHLDQSRWICEKLDRASHMWVHQCQQDASDAGPLRAAKHWKQNFTPWCKPCFTWESIAVEVASAIGYRLVEAQMLPEPLRFYVFAKCKARHETLEKKRLSYTSATESECEIVNPAKRLLDTMLRVIQKGSPFLQQSSKNKKDLCESLPRATSIRKLKRAMKLLDARRMQWWSMQSSAVTYTAYDEGGGRGEAQAQLVDVKEDTYYTQKLSIPQMRQLFSAYWVYSYGCVCAQTREAARVILCAYHLLGYYVRAVAQYRATAQHVGYGENLRQLKKAEYMRDKLPMHVVNRVYRPFGVWKGIGYRGCKGKHAPAVGVPVYQPQRRRKR
eukprot:6193386-Pleurochrysis_carterae.AAC.1